MKMKKLILSMVLMLGIGSQTWAQTMTYNHDESKEEQIKVMELGSGALSPEWYYALMHNSYKRGGKERHFGKEHATPCSKHSFTPSGGIC